MRRLSASIAAAAFLSCAGANTAGSPGEVVVRLGSSVIVSLDRDADGQVRASIVPAGQTAESTVTFALSDETSYRLLKLTNRTKYLLRMEVRVCIDQGARCAESNVLPLGPGLSNYESWSEPIDRVLLSNFRLEEAAARLE